MTSKLLDSNGGPLAMERGAKATHADDPVGIRGHLLSADGLPIESNRPDPQAVALAALQQDNTELRAENARLRSTLLEYEVEMLVELAITERRMLPLIREYAMSMGRRDIAHLKDFISTLPTLPGHGSLT